MFLLQLMHIPKLKRYILFFNQNSLFCLTRFLLGLQYYFFNFFYCCSITVIPIYSPLLSPAQLTPHLPHSLLPPLSLSLGLLHMFLDLTLPLLSPVIPLPTPLWLLSVCSLFPCLWFQFARLFVLLIRFHLKVRSYGICLLPPVISLGIMLSSSIQAVAKGRSSFFLSAVQYSIA